MEILTKLEDMWAQLESSWPKTMEKILRDFKHGGEDFYIYTFFKWDNHVDPPQYNVYHQPRWSWPDAFPGTVLRRVSPSKGWSKIIWCLPHQEGFKLYKEGKLFGDPIVDESIRKYLAGEFEKDPEEKLHKLKSGSYCKHQGIATPYLGTKEQERPFGDLQD